MFRYDIVNRLQKKLFKLGRKNPRLAALFYNKIQEVIHHDNKSIDTYKNLKSPKNHLKRIHLTSQFVLLFEVNKRTNIIYFADILHRDDAYK